MTNVARTDVEWTNVAWANVAWTDGTGALITFRDGSTNLKWPLRYFPWGDGGMGGEMSKLMLTQCLVRQTQNLFTSIHLKYDQVMNINIDYC